MKNDMIVFGCLHSRPNALKTILGHAEENNINMALNLGDESAYGSNWDSRNIYAMLRDWRDATPERRLICVAGQATREVIPELRKNYADMNEEGKVKGRSIFKEDNVLAAHEGRDILIEYQDFIRSYNGQEPLVIFQGHLHSMNVSREYRWLKDDEKIRFIKEGEKHWTLSSGVYWVSPGKASWLGNTAYGDKFKEAVNFALYHPKDRRVTLKSILK